ncbi:SDR family NAD(P)-dependent oxidoreductase [Thalassospira marina]|uniref:3-oxoacyl-ACP reductase n=1 Tax=Thalassospira marina TaxID=2048283 RepID=A0ABN5FQ51_9PROT|nr:SDR family oxidoreductase [Thalassospira marina]AUG53740.1 3-oxoacyl-ACP reductase [Thalassospira marina]
MNRFESKVVVITGAGSGIGAATAKMFYDEGASVVLSGRTEEKLLRTSEPFAKDRSLIAVGDIGKWEDAQALAAAAAEKFGKIDVLVNNAGTGWLGDIADDNSNAELERVFDTNVNGTFYGIKAALPFLKQSKGNVVNVSSVTGLRGDWGLSIYNASKAAVSNLTRCLALDYGSAGIRFNAVCPTYIRTELAGLVTNNQELLDKFCERIPLQRGGEPEEVAEAILFLASDAARFITGVNLPVDGGVTASSGQPDFRI